MPNRNSEMLDAACSGGIAATVGTGLALVVVTAHCYGSSYILGNADEFCFDFPTDVGSRIMAPFFMLGAVAGVLYEKYYISYLSQQQSVNPPTEIEEEEN